MYLNNSRITSITQMLCKNNDRKTIITKKERDTAHEHSQPCIIIIIQVVTYMCMYQDLKEVTEGKKCICKRKTSIENMRILYYLYYSA